MTWINLIGKEASVIESSNPNLLGISGKIIDETKNTIVIEGKKRWVVPKDTVNLLINGRIFYGNELYGRPIDRISRGGRR
ncbi:MAG: ribonuclease P protein subunit [Thermoplasmata archaeon]|jgi:RNase P/RNase MRP subunit p29|nr:ribonuclease P protein subunit [Thermoplasmata archaeon]MVT13798.1 ribonuclease P [Euryarchaeota archaeon]MVT15203.1 ribonuclease P [Euryarchaeota archaeon]MVT35689.1 ribonuclease P [Euryarchaeota archaeon]